jgi:uncharacterized membrane protein YhaH (DUF805 family)
MSARGNRAVRHRIMGDIVVNWKNLLFSFEGRVGRGAYWGLVVFSLLLFGGMSVFTVMSAISTGDPAQASGGASMAMMVAGLVFLWPALAIQAKRWHDVDKSAWWILINLVPVVGGLIALVFNGFVAGSPASNQFGPAPAGQARSGAATAGV